MYLHPVCSLAVLSSVLGHQAVHVNSFSWSVLGSDDGLLDSEISPHSMVHEKNSCILCHENTVSYTKVVSFAFLLLSRFLRQESDSSLQPTSAVFLRPESGTSFLGLPTGENTFPNSLELSPWNSPAVGGEGVTSPAFCQSGGWNSAWQQLYPKKSLHQSYQILYYLKTYILGSR